MLTLKEELIEKRKGKCWMRDDKLVEQKWRSIHIIIPILPIMNANIDTFRTLVDDPTLTDTQINKYITWSKGNLEQALNYYYRKLQKQSKEQPPNNTRNTRSQSNAFEKMKTASVREKKIEEFIVQVKEEYQLPVRRLDKKETKQARQMVDQDGDQFAEADYIPSMFKKCQEQDPQMDQYVNIKSKKRQQNEIVDLQLMEGDSMEVNLVQQPKNNQSQQEQVLERRTERRPVPKETPPQITKIPKTVAPVFRPTKSKSLIKAHGSPENSSQFGWIQGQSQFPLGRCILFAFALKFQNNLDLPQGTPLNFRYYIEQDKKKKAFKSKKQAEKILNLRLINKGSQFGRMKDEESRILVPLLVNGMIRMEIFAHTVPKRIDYYTSLKVTAKVYLMRKAITDPVVQTFEGHSDMVVSTYKPVAEELLALFDRLQLKIITWPLIKRHSKLKSKSNNTFTRSPLTTTKQNGKQTERERQLSRQQKMRNDPYYKQVQKNLTQMFKVTGKEESSNTQSIPKKEEKKQEEGEEEINGGQEKSAVKKKVLQIKAIDQDRCLQLVDLYEQDLQPCKPSPFFTSHLYHYQALALAWMLRRQGKDNQQHPQNTLHPLWTEYQTMDSRSLYLNELTSQLSLKPPYSKSKCLGGILADEMGLGKTVMMAALIASNQNPHRTKRQAGTLIIVPLTLLSQWQTQLQTHTKNTNTLVYYSNQRLKYAQILQKYQVVITTYGTVSHEFSKGCHLNKTNLYRYQWQRIVLDEAHYIKGRIIQTAKAVYQLQGQYRWCLTGTPIQNGLADLFSLLHFIRYTPWAQWQCFNKYILKPSEAGEEEVYEVLKTILKRVFLRRTKQSKDAQGKPIVQLPAKISKVEILQMNPKQRQFYDSIYQSSRLKLEQLQKLGILEARYMQVLEILMRLRQICCHPMLFKAVHKYTSSFGQFQQQLRTFLKRQANTLSSNQDDKYFQPLIQGEQQQRIQINPASNISESYLKEVLNKIEKHQLENCLVCLGDVQDPIITSCLHIFCKVCAIRQIEQCSICSACRNKIGKEDILHLPRENRFNSSLDSFFPSTKLLALSQHMKRLKSGDKAVVFSQFLGMLDLIEHQLKQENISYVRMEGSTPHKQRTRIVNSFQKDPKVQIFVVSLKTAGVGLNLVAANKVFLVDPWWNPGVQEQAIERVHRIGQKRAVEVIRLVMDQSIQMRMLELNTNKRQLSQKVLSHDNGTPGESRVQKLKYLMAKY